LLPAESKNYRLAQINNISVVLPNDVHSICYSLSMQYNIKNLTVTGAHLSNVQFINAFNIHLRHQIKKQY